MDSLIVASAVNPTTYRLPSVPLPMFSTSVHETLLTLAPLTPILPPDVLGPVAASFPVAEPISTSVHLTVGFVGERLNVASSWQHSLIGGRKGRKTGIRTQPRSRHRDFFVVSLRAKACSGSDVTLLRESKVCCGNQGY